VCMCVRVCERESALKVDVSIYVCVCVFMDVGAYVCVCVCVDVSA